MHYQLTWPIRKHVKYVTEIKCHRNQIMMSDFSSRDTHFIDSVKFSTVNGEKGERERVKENKSLAGNC